jgi:hypothetical protein
MPVYRAAATLRARIERLLRRSMFNSISTSVDVPNKEETILPETPVDGRCGPK